MTLPNESGPLWGKSVETAGVRNKRINYLNKKFTADGENCFDCYDFSFATNDHRPDYGRDLYLSRDPCLCLCRPYHGLGHHVDCRLCLVPDLYPDCLLAAAYRLLANSHHETEERRILFGGAWIPVDPIPLDHLQKARQDAVAVEH